MIFCLHQQPSIPESAFSFCVHSIPLNASKSASDPLSLGIHSSNKQPLLPSTRCSRLFAMGISAAAGAHPKATKQRPPSPSLTLSLTINNNLCSRNVHYPVTHGASESADRDSLSAPLFPDFLSASLVSLADPRASRFSCLSCRPFVESSFPFRRLLLPPLIWMPGIALRLQGCVRVSIVPLELTETDVIVPLERTLLLPFDSRHFVARDKRSLSALLVRHSCSCIHSLVFPS